MLLLAAILAVLAGPRSAYPGNLIINGKSCGAITCDLVFQGQAIEDLDCVARPRKDAPAGEPKAEAAPQQRGSTTTDSQAQNEGPRVSLRIANPDGAAATR
jgi:hypothetical protein